MTTAPAFRRPDRRHRRGLRAAHMAQPYGDPLAPFNEKMFWFNLKLDKYVLHPVASG